MDKKEFYFGFRFEEALEKKIDRYCNREKVSLNRLVARTVNFLAGMHDRGKIALHDFSGFKLRESLFDKIDVMLILSVEHHEVLRNLAIAYRRSMAEVLRLSLELFLQMDAGGKLLRAFHYYRAPIQLPRMVFISLFPALPPDKPPFPLVL